jgi:D-3-phosphoglycerate dehydrogenase
MPGFRVLMTDRAWPDSHIERQILSTIDAELIEAPATDEATLCSLAAPVDAIMTNWAKVTPQVVRTATRCQVICRLGIGLDNIAVDTATELRIPVTNIPDYCVREVADHTLALLLACARKITFFHHRTKQGEYRLQAGPAMHRLQGQVLGLVGLGRIARDLVPKARALGLQVVAHSSSGNDYGTGIPMVSFDELLACSDYISLHAPATAQSRGMFRLPQFERMRRGAYLINTSRGALIDEADLWTALQQDLIAGAALDVFEPEPPDLSQPLFQDERVIVTPHAAFVSEESLAELRTRVATQVVEVFSGRRPENIINPQVLEG